MKILKNRIFLVLATVIIVGSITAYATISPDSESIIYDNTNSGLTSTNMQDAIDELYNKASNINTTNQVSNISGAAACQFSNGSTQANTLYLDVTNYNKVIIESNTIAGPGTLSLNAYLGRNYNNLITSWSRTNTSSTTSTDETPIEIDVSDISGDIMLYTTLVKRQTDGVCGYLNNIKFSN